MKNIAVIFAGGVGKRMKSKGKPKQFLEIHGKPVIVYTLEYFEKHASIDSICIVSVAEWLDYMRELVVRYGFRKVHWMVPGGRRHWNPS